MMIDKRSRRDFLKISGITSTGLAIGFTLPNWSKNAFAANKGASPNAFLQIDIKNQK